MYLENVLQKYDSNETSTDSNFALELDVKHTVSADTARTFWVTIINTRKRNGTQQNRHSKGSQNWKGNGLPCLDGPTTKFYIIT